MMIKPTMIRAILIGLSVSGVMTAAVAQSPTPDELKTRIDQVAQQEMAADHGVGLVVGVLHNGERLVFAYGETFKGTGRKPDDKTLFEIGSITKTFTAMQLAAEVRNGKAQLN